MTSIRVFVVILLAACRGGSERTVASAEIAPSVTDGGVVRIDAAVGPLVDESAPAKLAFIGGEGRSLMGHIRASWPLDLPEMPWVANTFVNLSLDSFDGTSVIGSVEMYAAPGLDARKCTIEVLWDARNKHGVQLAGAPTIERVDEQIGTRAAWRFRSPIASSPPAVQATAYAFCPNDVMFYSIDMVVPGPRIRAEYCKSVRRDPHANMAGTNSIAGHTFDLQFACGALIRLRRRDLVDECHDEVLLSLDALGPQVTASAPAAGTPIGDEELRQWHAGSIACSSVQLAATPSFAATAAKPFAAFVKRAGDRLLSAFSRDGMIQP